MMCWCVCVCVCLFVFVWGGDLFHFWGAGGFLVGRSG